MTEVDAVIVGDVHLADRQPSSRVAGYTEQILGKISFAADLAKEHGVPLVFAGDVFHIKAASKNSHKLVQATHDALGGVEAIVLPGNHDLEGDRLDSLNKQPLGALSRMDNVRLLMGMDEVYPWLGGIPYLTEFDGGDWKHALDEYMTSEDRIEDWSTVELLVTHAPMFPPGQEPGVYASLPTMHWAQYWVGIPYCYYGHIHDYHGVYEVEGMTFCNQGALSRGSLHESSVNREPAVTFFSRVRGFSRVGVPHEPAESVFLFAEAAAAKESKASAREFAEILGTTTLAALTVEEVVLAVRSQNAKPLVAKIAEECLESVQ